LIGKSTSVQISVETWRQLQTRKQGPNDTFENVIDRLLSKTDSGMANQVKADYADGDSD
jgi:predicted CopG family antitoxin